MGAPVETSMTITARRWPMRLPMNLGLVVLLLATLVAACAPPGRSSVGQTQNNPEPASQPMGPSGS